MNQELVISNIQKFARAKGESTSRACINGGAGTSFISDLRRGRVPAVDKFANLAAYLGVSTSDLLGDAHPAVLPDDQRRLLAFYEKLNEEGQDKLLDYADDLVQSEKYIKNRSSQLGDKKAE